MSLLETIGAMLVCANQLKDLATSFMQLPPFTERQHKWGEMPLEASA